MDLTPSRDDWPRISWDRPGPFLLSDDPADHGLSAAEVACIEKAYEIRRREVRAALMQPSPFEIDWGLSGMEWPKTLKEWAKWVLVVPFVMVLLAIVQTVAAPFQYVAHRRERAREKAQLREELKQLERRPLLRPIEEKTLWELWRVYGFEDRRFPEAVCVELAATWIDRLYGPETTRAVNLVERLERVNLRRAKQRAKATGVTCILLDAEARAGPAGTVGGTAAVRLGGRCGGTSSGGALALREVGYGLGRSESGGGIRARRQRSCLAPHSDA